MYFFILKAESSLQMAKFHRNEIPELPTFSRHDVGGGGVERYGILHMIIVSSVLEVYVTSNRISIQWIHCSVPGNLL